jgi:DNA invertase Pin-like site-specific DNA recombinase
LKWAGAGPGRSGVDPGGAYCFGAESSGGEKQEVVLVGCEGAREVVERPVLGRYLSTMSERSSSTLLILEMSEFGKGRTWASTLECC